MAEEFEESDVIFSDHEHHHHHQERSYFRYREMGVVFSHDGQQRKKSSVVAVAAEPMNIPMSNVLLRRQFEEFNDEVAAEEEEECGEELEPPHVILGRRVAGKMQFSVCTGNGRTLKGRDLSEVRNSILRMTGFLET